ncbi:unnamed protein product [Albugo candida]|uniref:enoyl-[acyl-carrier-protein] reductase n=2 Tax=Albugo candida TaxID=65357 RepID=A0A024GKP1_9STRA|nr:unnamed protein product [Albugo candida]|eukprot:CCI47304.1 unnamed protein product [Albugo candida]
MSMNPCFRKARFIQAKRVHQLSQRLSTIRYEEYGHPFQVLKKEEDEKETHITENQIAIKMLAAPIHVADLSQIQGNYAIRPPLPAIAGNEGVALVTAVGSNVQHLKVNDHVVTCKPGFGTWRLKAVADAKDVVKVSKKIELGDAATLSVNPATAYILLKEFQDLKEGDVVIQNAANSAVGMAVIQLAALRGIKTINIVRDDADYDLTNEHLKCLGGTIVATADYLGSATFKRLIADLPAPKLALNAVGGRSSLELGRVLGRKGVHVTYGGMSRQCVMIGTGSLIFHDISLRGFWMSEWYKNTPHEKRVALLQELAGLVEQGKLRNYIQTYKFTDFEDALAAAVNRTTKRKVVMLMD